MLCENNQGIAVGSRELQKEETRISREGQAWEIDSLRLWNVGKKGQQVTQNAEDKNETSKVIER